MELIGAILVFLGFVCASLAAGIFWALVRLAQSRDEQHAEAMARAEEHHRALCAQLTAAMERAHLLAAGLAAEVHAMAAAHRNDLRLAARLAPLCVPGEQPPRKSPRSALRRAERPRARRRRQLRQHAGTAEKEAEDEPEDDLEPSAVRRCPDVTHGARAPSPPLAP